MWEGHNIPGSQLNGEAECHYLVTFIWICLNTICGNALMPRHWDIARIGHAQKESFMESFIWNKDMAEGRLYSICGQIDGRMRNLVKNDYNYE